MIPTHEADGFLPAGIHGATWTEVVERFGWTVRRATLLAALKAALLHLANAGCASVLLGGSFVTTKANPKDTDVVWNIEGVDPDQLHPVFLGPDGLDAIKAHFGADMFPSMLIEADSGEPFSEFFQHARDGHRIGVVRVSLSTIDRKDDHE